MTSSIVPLSNGTRLLPTSTWRGWGGYCPDGMKMVTFVSSDQGKTWPTYYDVMSDDQRVNIFWESKMVELEDGRLLSAAWVYDQQNDKDLDNHYSISTQTIEERDSQEGVLTGLSFTPPSSCGLKGQTLQLYGLENGKVLTVYRRTDRPDLWANLSRIDGEQWINGQEFPLWGDGSLGLTTHTGNMAGDFAVLKFGAPSVCLLKSGILFISFWAVEEGVSNIRWIKIRLETVG